MMDEAGPDTKLCKKELRKQKLMEYLAAKGKLKPPNPKPYLRDDYPGKKSALEPANGKENQLATAVIKHEVTNTVKAAIHVLQPTGKAHVKQSFTKGGVLSASQRVNGASAPTVLTRPPAVKGKPLVMRTYTIAALKASAANNQRPKQSGSLVKPNVPPGTVKSDDSSAQQTITHPHRTSHAKAGSNATHVIETKKGTSPVGPRPRNVKSNPTQGRSAITTATIASNTTRVCPTRAPSASKGNPSAALHKPFQCGSTVARAASLISHDRPASRGHAKPVSKKTLQPSQPGLPSAAGKQTLLSTRAMMGTGRLDLTHRVGIPAGALQGKPARGTADERPGAKVAGRARQAVAGSGMSAGTKSQCGGGSAGGPGNHLREKGEVRKVNKVDTGTIPPKRTTASSPPIIPQTLPRCGTRVPKTPGLQGCRAPQTEGKKSTAAQEERMKKLQEWRDTKGISYKRPPMPVRPQSRRTLALPQPYWSTMGEEDEAHSLICAVDRSLGDCIKLLAEGCSPEHVTKVLSRLPPLAKKFAKYWICQARLMERQGNLDVLPMFEEAVRLVLEPVDDLRTVVFDILKKRDERAKESMEEADQEVAQRDAASLGPDAVNTPQPVRALIQGERGYSSAVKYKITATPGGGQSQQRGRFRVDGQEVRFFTPVRRSVRIERASLGYPAYLREQDPCVASYDDLLAEDELEGSGGERRGASGEAPGCTATPMYVYRENEALRDQVKVQLVYDDDE